MQVFVEITSSLGRRLTVVVPPEEIDGKINTRVQELTRTMRIDGFRPGKVPASVIKKRYGEAVRHEVLEQLLESSMQAALAQEKLHPAHTPHIQSFKADPGAALEYSAAFDIYPEVKIRNLDDVTLEKLVVTIEDADIDQAMEQMRQQHMQWDEVQRAAEWGDKITVDLQGLVDDQPVEKLHDKNVALVLDESMLPPGFSALVGAHAGEEITIDLLTPEKAAGPHQGKTATRVQIKVHSVAAPRLPELNEEFAERLGITQGGLAELRTKVREHMQQDLNLRLREKLKAAVIDKFLKRHPVELPKATIDAEYHHLEKELRANIEKELQRPATERLPEGDRKKLQAIARRRVALAILFPAVVAHYSMKIDEKRVREHVEHMAISGMGKMSDKFMAGVRAQVLEEQVVDQLLSQVKFTEKTVSYHDAVKFAEQQDEAPAADPFLPSDAPAR